LDSGCAIFKLVVMEENVIEIQICWYVDENGKNVYDEDHMREEFEDKLTKLLNQNKDE